MKLKLQILCFFLFCDIFLCRECDFHGQQFYEYFIEQVYEGADCEPQISSQYLSHIYYKKDYYVTKGDFCYLRVYYDQRVNEQMFIYEKNEQVKSQIENQNCIETQYFFENSIVFEQYIKQNTTKQLQSLNNNEQYIYNKNQEYVRIKKLENDEFWSFIKAQEYFKSIEELKKYPNYEGKYCFYFVKDKKQEDLQYFDVYLSINQTQNDLIGTNQLAFKFNNDQQETVFEDIMKNFQLIVQLKSLKLYTSNRINFLYFHNNVQIFMFFNNQIQQNSYQVDLDILFRNFLLYRCKETYLNSWFIRKNLVNIINELSFEYELDREGFFLNNHKWITLKSLFLQIFKTNKLDQKDQKIKMQLIFSQLENFIIQNCNCLQKPFKPQYYQFLNGSLDRRFDNICYARKDWIIDQPRQRCKTQEQDIVQNIDEQRLLKKLLEQKGWEKLTIRYLIIYISISIIINF